MPAAPEPPQEPPPAWVGLSRDALKSFPHSKRVGNYLVGRMINKGSFARVMEGLHITTGEKVAMKVIDKKKARQDSYVQKNMKREPRIHQMIRHPNIVQLYETLETENSYYMVMELCRGGDLMDQLCEQKRLDERQVRRFTRQILSAVEHLHRHGIVHRDLKIENFLLDENNNLKIVENVRKSRGGPSGSNDFGLSNTLRAEPVAPELLHTQCGSPAYAAPELLAHRKYGPKVDVWSVGVSVFAMLSGTLPFTVEPFNIKQLHQKMVNGDMNSFPTDISTAAVQFIMALLEPEPEKRPSVRDAMEHKWLNEGFARTPLISLSYRNRLGPEELDPAVLSYVSESLGHGLSDVVHTLVHNRPSPVMAAYCLLVRKLARHHGEIEVKENSLDQTSRLSSKTVKNQSSETVGTATENMRNPEDIRNPSPPPSADGITEVIQEDKGTHFPEVLLPLKASKEAACPQHLQPQASDPRTGTPMLLRTQKPIPHPTSCEEGTGVPETRFRDLLQAVDDRAPSNAWQDRDRGFAPKSSPLPKLRHSPLKDRASRKVTWVGQVPFLVNGSRQPLFTGATPRQQALVIRNLRQPRDRGRNSVSGTGGTARRNAVQLRMPNRTTELNLPMLSPAFHSKAEKKPELLRTGF